MSLDPEYSHRSDSGFTMQTPIAIGDKIMKQALLLLLMALFLTSVGFSGMAAQEASSTHVWRESVKTDANRGTVFNRYTLTGKFLKAPQHGDTSNRPALVVDCNSAKERCIEDRLRGAVGDTRDVLLPKGLRPISHERW
jgi:hypothetical protein